MVKVAAPIPAPIKTGSSAAWPPARPGSSAQKDQAARKADPDPFIFHKINDQQQSYADREPEERDHEGRKHHSGGLDHDPAEAEKKCQQQYIKISHCLVFSCP